MSVSCFHNFSHNTTIKSTVLATHSPEDSLLFPKRKNAVGLLRLRLGLNWDIDDDINAEIAYEHRGRYTSNAFGSAGGILPSFADAPWRIRQLDWEIIDNGDRFAHRHEIDRALVAFHPEWGEVTIGRQAIGLGRGVIFSAVDIFSPFSPVEVDREWRRGVDAFRVE
ncbi:hypothetical protein ACFL1X_05225, partial [Candidatus Hydrogenedentota bacterium]